MYKVVWDNGSGHASGEFGERFRTKREAVRFARAWKRGMVESEEPKDRKSAREDYQWEVMEDEE
jgi:hypothetical protein